MSFGHSKHRSRFSGASFKGNEKVKMSHTKGFAKLASVVAVGTALTACGGGGGSGTSTTTSTTNTQLTGKAIDGYLSGAKVCFDNGQGACDTSLPSTTTDANGNYTLTVSSSVAGKQLDVLVTSDTTDGGNKFTSTFTMSAVITGNSQNVTPLTTMVVAQMKAGKSQADAITAVQTLVGSSVDPNADYVGNGDTGTATTAASMVSHMTALAGQGPISWSQVQATMNAYAAKGSIIGVQQSDVDAQLANPAYSSPADATTALANPCIRLTATCRSSPLAAAQFRRRSPRPREFHALGLHAFNHPGGPEQRRLVAGFPDWQLRRRFQWFVGVQ